MWAQPRGPAGLAGYPVLRWIYARADAVATYGPHVSAYVRRRGARHVHDAPQAVDGAFWSAPADRPTRLAAFQALFVGRLEEEKGVGVLLDAWRRTGLGRPGGGDWCSWAAGPCARRPRRPPPCTCPAPWTPPECATSTAGSDVAVVPSIPTRTFREPWGLVVNEAMHQGLPVIATDAVGAAAGGLVRHERNGLVVPAGDPHALAGAIARVHDDVESRDPSDHYRSRGTVSKFNSTPRFALCREVEQGLGFGSLVRE